MMMILLRKKKETVIEIAIKKINFQQIEIHHNQILKDRPIQIIKFLIEESLLKQINRL